MYAKGRTDGDHIVTNARGGRSNHNFGIAFDIGVFDAQGHYFDESPAYGVVGPLGEALGLEWGGRWVSFKDRPHYQLRPAWAAELSEEAMLAQLRTLHDHGSNPFA